MEVTRPFDTMARGGRERARLLRARDARILKVCPNALERNTLDDAVVLWNRWKRPGCGPSLSKWSASEKLRGKVLQKSRGVAAQEKGRRCTAIKIFQSWY